MAGRHSKRGKGHRVETPDLELMPMLNVFISIIPMLLLSAAFVQLAVIDTGLPAPSAAAVADARAEAVPPVVIRVRGDRYVIEGAGPQAREIARGRDAATAEGTRLQLEALLRTCAAAGAVRPEVRIVPEPGTPYAEIILLMDLARAAGLPHAALADEARGAV